MKKITYFILTVAAAAVFVSANVDAAPRRATRKTDSLETLKQENALLRARLDSLLNVLEAHEAHDSLANEIFDIYEENSALGEGLAPEDYNTEVSDSLLQLWYAGQQKLRKPTVQEYDMDSVKFTSNIPDSVYIRKIKEMNSFITLPYNEIVRNYLILYSEKMPEKLSHILGACQYYMPVFQEILNRYDLPEELAAMAVIESAMNPVAVSRAGAKGMWQFMYSTAKIYGLHIDSFVDERMDPVKSADAAARYLQDSYRIFGDWALAISSYNCGVGNVNKAIRRAGGSRAFWDIYPYLPRETRGYVPAFVGALYAMKYHTDYGIVPAETALPVHVDTFSIRKMVHLQAVTDLVGIPLEQVRALNPQYRHDIIPGNNREYTLTLPVNYTNAFIENEDSLAIYKAEVFYNPVAIKKIVDGGDGERIVYKVKNGDYLGRIASRHHVSVAQIKKWNHLKNNNIRVGQRLIIYRGGKAPSSTSASSGKNSSGKTASASGSGKSAANSGTAKSTGNFSDSGIRHTVKSGESLYLIAKKYPGISANDIMNFNGIGSSIKPGMVLKIPKN